MWRVFRNCRIRDRDGLSGDPVDKYVVVPPEPIDVFSGNDEEGELLSAYRPLIDAPELFLEFARLADGGGLDLRLEAQKNQDVALGWAETYGVLGLTRGPELGGPFLNEIPERAVYRGLFGGIFSVEEPDEMFAGGIPAYDAAAGSDVGGRGDTVVRFAYEAWIANTVLRLYEAATNPSGVDLVAIQKIWKALSYPGAAPGDKETAEWWALSWVKNRMQLKLARDVYPWVYGTKVPVQGWAFTSLLGAMWLQMMWLYMVGRDANGARRCKYEGCTKVITFDKPEQSEETAYSGPKTGRRKKYKTRLDKQFCSDNHRVQHHQHKKKGGGHSG